ncbi:MAG: hypothetical protein GSR72_06410 [Desulfurococcales archaeon]|nr:hypothetical protein [Desulfurococcales archaeon]MEB3789506.1 hypothetical protein [Desulfurococcales archaeon]
MSIPIVIRKAIRRGTNSAVQPAALPPSIADELLEMSIDNPIVYSPSTLENNRPGREKEKIYAKYGYLLFLGPFK